MGSSSRWPHDASPAASKGRVSVAWVDGLLRGGLTLISLYLWHSEGTSCRNMELLHKAGEIAAATSGPWLIAGDFNMTPLELEEGASLWLQKVGGVVIAPCAWTCRSANGGRTIDFAVIDARVRNAIQSIGVDFGFPSSPHRAVRIRLRCAASREVALQLKRPWSFSATRPIGCPRKPEKPDSDIMAKMDSEAGLGTVAALDTTYSHLVSLA